MKAYQSQENPEHPSTSYTYSIHAALPAELWGLDSKDTLCFSAFSLWSKLVSDGALEGAGEAFGDGLGVPFFSSSGFS